MNIYIEFPIEFPKYRDKEQKKTFSSGRKIWPDAIAGTRDLASATHRAGRSYPRGCGPTPVWQDISCRTSSGQTAARLAIRGKIWQDLARTSLLMEFCEEPDDTSVSGPVIVSSRGVYGCSSLAFASERVDYSVLVIR